MAKFRIETNLPDDDKTVEAAHYRLEAGYFWFRDQRNEDLYTIDASEVITIERVTDAS